MPPLFINSIPTVAKASNTQEMETTTAEKEVELRPKALDLLLGSDSPGSSIEDSDPVQDEVEDFFKQQQQPWDSRVVEGECMQIFYIGSIGKEAFSFHSHLYTLAEQVFSVAGLIVLRLRTSLTPEHVDMLVFLNKNMDLMWSMCVVQPVFELIALHVLSFMQISNFLSNTN